MSEDLKNGLFMRTSADSFYNSRTKFYVNNVGDLVPYEVMICNRQVFSDGGAELSDYSKELQRQLDYREAAAELFGNKPTCSRGYIPQPATKEELLDASRRRARRKVFDYCICNDFDLFITLTLDKRLIDRDDYGAIIKKLNTFLGNRVRRKGLKYIGVPEYHQNGGLHFHFAATSGAFKLVDSGTVSVENVKRPMKRETARKKGIPESEWHTVYNIADWSLGFSTAIYTYGERGAVAHYLAKELCKDEQKRLCKQGAIGKIGGRWYYHGGDLNKPICKYDNKNYADYKDYSYTVDTDGGAFKVYKYTENGEILR